MVFVDYSMCCTVEHIRAVIRYSVINSADFFFAVYTPGTKILGNTLTTAINSYDS